MRPAHEQVVECLGTISRDNDAIHDVALLERTQRELFVVGVVLDEQDDFFAQDGSGKVK
jgi:hypothetical protein